MRSFRGGRGCGAALLGSRFFGGAADAAADGAGVVAVALGAVGLATGDGVPRCAGVAQW